MEPVADSQLSREQPDVGDLLPRRPTLDLEHGCGELAVDVALDRGEEPRDPVQHGIHAGARDRGAEEHRMDQRATDLPPQLALESVGGQGRPVHVGREDLFVVLGEQTTEQRVEPDVHLVERSEVGLPRADHPRRSHRDDRWRSLSTMSRSTPSCVAPARSILFTKISVRTPSRCSVRARMRVCGCTPSTADTTSTAPSSTFKTRSTSAMKSGWPGVSIRLTATSSMTNDDGVLS